MSFGSTKSPTKAEAARMAAISESTCVIARHLGLGYVPATVHHLTIGGRHGQKRRGHRFTVALNYWSHLGHPFGNYTAAECKAMFGPSYAKEPRAFRELYSDDWLLAETDAMIGWQE